MGKRNDAGAVRGPARSRALERLGRSDGTFTRLVVCGWRGTNVGGMSTVHLLCQFLALARTVPATNFLAMFTIRLSAPRGRTHNTRMEIALVAIHRRIRSFQL